MHKLSLLLESSQRIKLLKKKDAADLTTSGALFIHSVTVIYPTVAAAMFSTLPTF